MANKEKRNASATIPENTSATYVLTLSIEDRAPTAGATLPVTAHPVYKMAPVSAKVSNAKTTFH
jgi:hypothetical protein